MQRLKIGQSLIYMSSPPSHSPPQPSAPHSQSMGERFFSKKGCLGEQMFSANYLWGDVLSGD